MAVRNIQIWLPLNVFWFYVQNLYNDHFTLCFDLVDQKLSEQDLLLLQSW